MSSKDRFCENMSKITGEHPCKGVYSVKCELTLPRSHFRYSYIISEYFQKNVSKKGLSGAATINEK